MNLYSIKSEHIIYISRSLFNKYYYTIVWMKVKIFIILKSNALAVFHSHWSNFVAVKPIHFLIDSTDWLDAVFCDTVSRLFEFWLNDDFHPRDKQKQKDKFWCSFLLCGVKTWWPSVTTVTCFFVLWWVMWCAVMGCVFLRSVTNTTVNTIDDVVVTIFYYYYLMLLLLLLFFWYYCWQHFLLLLLLMLLLLLTLMLLLMLFSTDGVAAHSASSDLMTFITFCVIRVPKNLSTEIMLVSQNCSFTEILIDLRVDPDTQINLMRFK